MDPRKLIAFRTKLTELYTDKKAIQDEVKALSQLLTRDRKKGTLSDANRQILNEIDLKKCDGVCVVKSADVPSVHYLKDGMECKFFYDTDSERYVVFVEREIPPEHQLTYKIIQKEERGHFPDEKEYPKTKILLHRLDLTSGEFDKWFKVEKDSESVDLSADEEETYEF